MIQFPRCVLYEEYGPYKRPTMASCGKAQARPLPIFLPHAEPGKTKQEFLCLRELQNIPNRNLEKRSDGPIIKRQTGSRLLQFNRLDTAGISLIALDCPSFDLAHAHETDISEVSTPQCPPRPLPFDYGAGHHCT